MKLNPIRLRQLHSFLAPIMVLPLLLTLITGFIFQWALLAGQGGDFYWLVELHKGNFGNLKLEAIYPFLNALGLLTLLITGMGLWLQSWKRRARRSS